MKSLFFLLFVVVFLEEPALQRGIYAASTSGGRATLERPEGRAPLPNDAAFLAAWITVQQYTNSQQPSYGGIRVGQGIAATTTGGLQYCRVSPYSANLAVGALLAVKAPPAIPVAGRWIDWYFAHLASQDAADGVPCDHFYFPDGGGETTCVKPGDRFLCDHNDATDSAAATFFSVLWAAYRAGLPPAELNAPERRREVVKLAGVLMKLQQSDGLFWAKADYRVKYLEDNCEVFAGLTELANLESHVFDDAGPSAGYRKAANHVQQAIFSELYDSHARLFRIAKFENGSCPSANLDTWYPDAQAQLWPVIFGVMAPTDPRSQAASAAISDHWNGRVHPDWAGEPELVNQGWVEAGHVYGAWLLGDTNRVTTYLTAVKRYKFQAAHGKRSFSWPFSVDDAGWLVRIMAAEP